MKLTASTGCVFILVCIAIAAGPGDGKSKEFVTPTAKAAKALFERQVGEAEQAKQVKVAAAKAE